MLLHSFTNPPLYFGTVTFFYGSFRSLYFIILVLCLKYNVMRWQLNPNCIGVYGFKLQSLVAIFYFFMQSQSSVWWFHLLHLFWDLTPRIPSISFSSPIFHHEFNLFSSQNHFPMASLPSFIRCSSPPHPNSTLFDLLLMVEEFVLVLG